LFENKKNGATMRPRRILFSWVGYADIQAMARSLPPQEQAEVLRGLDPPARPPSGNGPVKDLLALEQFDEVHLLSQFHSIKNNHYLKWLGGNPVLHPVEITTPSDFAHIFKVVDAELASVVKTPRTDKFDLCMHLSAGNRTMTAIWLFLGKSKYSPTTFLQTCPGRVWVTDVPFDLVVDFVPQVLRGADANLQRLASHSPQEVAGFQDIAGDSRGIREAVGRARRAASRDVPVLILGESGTGKEMFARAIHKASPRRDKPFLTINCAAISRELLESELFGHTEGAFTGAVSDRDGAFTEADGGTLFLDEVSECDPSMQAKLLRVLQPAPGADPCHRVFYRVGESTPTESDVRVIAATNRDLPTAINQHQFREDLYYRLAVITIKLPPLRDRRGDIPLVVTRLLTQIERDFKRREPGYNQKAISSSAMEFVKRHCWPGNVRQLYNALVQAAVMTDEDVIDRRDIEDAVAEVEGKTLSSALDLPLGEGFCLDDHLDKIHRHYLARAMQEAGGVKKRAAALLGIKNYQTLAARLERFELEATTDKQPP
jgi:DNA-binding NtrC family response regulator